MVAERRAKPRERERECGKRRRADRSCLGGSSLGRSQEGESPATASLPQSPRGSKRIQASTAAPTVAGVPNPAGPATGMPLERGPAVGGVTSAESGLENTSLPSSAASSASSLSSMASIFSDSNLHGDGIPPPPNPLNLPNEASIMEDSPSTEQADVALSTSQQQQQEVGVSDFSPVLHLPPFSEYSPGLSPMMSPAVEKGVEMRVHPRTAKELQQVDENPACLVSPFLDPDHPRTGRCHMTHGHTGRAKAFRGPTEEHRGLVTLYGEDAVAAGEMAMAPGDEGDERWVRVLAVFDGHGLMGKEAARVAAERLLHESDRNAGELTAALLRHDVAAVKNIELRKYGTLDAHLEESLRSPTGGTTCSCVKLVRAQSRLFMVVSNVGDSPVLLINNKTKHVSIVSGRHSWDNPEERSKYLKRCSSLGLTAREVVYGRINCGGMRMEDLRGGMEEPFLMYKPGTAVIDPQARDHLCKQVEKRYKNSIGGSQSIRRFVVERRTFSGSWETAHAMIEHGHVNWGATILVNREGKIQMSRSLGDLHEKQTAYIWAEPDVAVYEFSPDEDATIVVCSDGISDLWYFHELGELTADFFAAHPQGDAQQLADQILELTLDRGAKTPGYGIGPRHAGLRRDDPIRRPGWDDVALQVIRLYCPPAAEQLPRPPSCTAVQPPVVPMEG